MVEAAIASASAGRRVVLRDLLEESYRQALADETNPEVLEVLRSWTNRGAPKIPCWRACHCDRFGGPR